MPAIESYFDTEINFSKNLFQALDEIWLSKVRYMDIEAVNSMQNFCNVFDRNGGRPDKMVIINIPHLVDDYYSKDPLRFEIVKFSYSHRAQKTRIIHFRDPAKDSESDTDSLYEVSSSTSDGCMRPKLVLPSPDEFSDEEITGDSAMN